jgi:hypothetical protein
MRQPLESAILFRGGYSERELNRVARRKSDAKKAQKNTVRATVARKWKELFSEQHFHAAVICDLSQFGFSYDSSTTAEEFNDTKKAIAYVKRRWHRYAKSNLKDVPDLEFYSEFDRPAKTLRIFAKRSYGEEQRQAERRILHPSAPPDSVTRMDKAIRRTA